MTEFIRINQHSEHIATIRDTGISIHTIISEAVAGSSHSDILTKYPQLESDDIYQALSYTVQRQSIARIDSLQELRPEIATISGYGDLFLVGLRSDQLTSRQIARIIASNANMLNYKCMYQITRARLLNPWFTDTNWGTTTLSRLQSQLGTYLSPNLETIEISLEYTDKTIEIDSRLVPITGFLTQGYDGASIIISQVDDEITFEVSRPPLPANYAPLAQVEYLAQVILELLNSELRIEQAPDLNIYRYTVQSP